MKLLVIEYNHALEADLFAYFAVRGNVPDAAPDGATGVRSTADRAKFRHSPQPRDQRPSVLGTTASLRPLPTARGRHQLSEESA